MNSVNFSCLSLLSIKICVAILSFHPLVCFIGTVIIGNKENYFTFQPDIYQSDNIYVLFEISSQQDTKNHNISKCWNNYCDVLISGRAVR
jgi:hypothetical protein